MQPIDGVKLEELVKSASANLLAQRKEKLSNKIQGMFHRIDGLVHDINKLEQELDKKRKKLNVAQERMSRLQKGDWSVIDEKEEKQD